MRKLALLLLTVSTAALLPLAASAQTQPAGDQQDPMVVPAGMQAVPSTPRDLPAGVSAEAVQAATPTATAPAAAPAPTPAAPEAKCDTGMQIRISHGITYISGGSTQADIEQFKALDGEFNLQLLFAAKTGEHLVNQRVRLLDYHNFELVSATNVGPYFYARINPGDYMLEVTYENGSAPIKMKVKVPAKNRLRKTVLLK